MATLARLDLDSRLIQSEPSRLRTALVLSVVLIPLTVLATVGGLFVPSLYRGSPAWIIQARAQDIVTLVVAVPLLTVSLAFAARGSVRGYLLWMGTIGYLIYSYVIFAFDVPFNGLFLTYVAILGLSIYSLVFGLIAVDPRGIARSFGARTPTGWIGGALLGICILAGLLWLSDDVPAIIGGHPPGDLAEYALLTNPVHVLDLGIVLPGGILTGLLVLRRRPWGYILAGYYLVKFLALGLAINAISVISLVAGQPIDVAVSAMFAVISVIAVVLTWLYLKSVQPVVPPAIRKTGQSPT